MGGNLATQRARRPLAGDRPPGGGLPAGGALIARPPARRDSHLMAAHLRSEAAMPTGQLNTTRERYLGDSRAGLINQFNQF